MRSDVQTILDRQAAPPNGNDGHSGEASLYPLPDLKERVDAFRLDSHLKVFQRKRRVADLVIADLLARGKLIRTRNNQLFFFDATTKTLEPLDAEEFRACLNERFGLNPTEDESRFVEHEIYTVAMTIGEHQMWLL